MTWYDNIYKIGIEKLDLGSDFPPAERYEYFILIYDKQGNKDKIPGHFTTLNGENGVKYRVKEISDIVKQNTSHGCKVDKKIETYILDQLSESKTNEVIEKRENEMIKFRARRSVQYSNQKKLNSNPGGDFDHSKR